MPTHRNGKKIGGNHTTFIELAAILTDIAVKLPEVTRVSPGFIQSGPDMAGGNRRVKAVLYPNKNEGKTTHGSEEPPVDAAGAQAR